MTPTQQRNQMIASAARALALTQPEQEISEGCRGRRYQFGGMMIVYGLIGTETSACLDIFTTDGNVAAFRVHNPAADPAQQMLEVVSLNVKRMAEWLPLLCAACDRHAPQFRLTIAVAPPRKPASSGGAVAKPRGRLN